MIFAGQLESIFNIFLYIPHIFYKFRNKLSRYEFLLFMKSFICPPPSLNQVNCLHFKLKFCYEEIGKSALLESKRCLS